MSINEEKGNLHSGVGHPEAKQRAQSSGERQTVQLQSLVILTTEGGFNQILIITFPLQKKIVSSRADIWFDSFSLRFLPPAK